MLIWFMRWQELLKKYPKKILYVASALLPMTIMLLVWASIGMYPFGNKSLMAVDFGQQYISFFGLLKNDWRSLQFELFIYQISWWRYDWSFGLLFDEPLQSDLHFNTTKVFWSGCILNDLASLWSHGNVLCLPFDQTL